jgi:electron transfer flavoprotein alpha subunit
MEKILVFLEKKIATGDLTQASLEALSEARKLSSDVSAILFGPIEINSKEALKNFGLKTLYSFPHKDLNVYSPIPYRDGLCQVIQSIKPQVVLGSASQVGKDLFPRIAIRIEAAGLLTDLVSLVTKDGSLQGGAKPLYAGKVLGQIIFDSQVTIKMVTLRPNSFTCERQAVSENFEIQDLSCENLKESLSLQPIEEIKGANLGAKIELGEARCIISGGRSLGSASSFNILHECAQVLGNTAVGASRAAVDSGYATHDMQVGQTGKTVNPELYIACGISGAIQHMAGMRTSKVIVAINTDPKAPIFSVADYGIVGDLFQIVPLLTEKLKGRG